MTLFLYDEVTTEYGDKGIILAVDRENMRVLISTTDGVLYWAKRLMGEVNHERHAAPAREDNEAVGS